MPKDDELTMVLDALALAAAHPENDALVRDALSKVRQIELRYYDPHLSSYTSRAARLLDECLKYKSFAKKKDRAAEADDYLRYRLKAALDVARARKSPPPA